MIITADEYRAMGFTAEDEDALARCIERAGFVLDALTDCKASAAAEKGGRCAELVKRAAAFQTASILRAEIAQGSSGSREERVSLGDYSYTSISGSDTVSAEAVDTDLTVVRLLRAAGCLFGGLEARE